MVSFPSMSLFLCMYVAFISFIVVSGLSNYEESSMNNKGNFIDDYHFPMVADDVRNEKFYSALENVIIPGKSNVIDVGAGSMLLSMMAADLGAVRVLGVEVNPVMCKLAKEVLQINNFTNNTSSGNIRLYEDRFEKLKVGHKHVSSK